MSNAKIKPTWYGVFRISNTRYLTGPLGVFDLGLGLICVLYPEIYISLMHTGEYTSDVIFLRRTGVIWLMFSAVEFMSCIYGSRLPLFVFSTGVLRIVDVLPDIFYLLFSGDLTLFGKAMLVFAPIFNLVAGSYLITSFVLSQKADSA